MPLPLRLSLPDLAILEAAGAGVVDLDLLPDLPDLVILAAAGAAAVGVVESEDSKEEAAAAASFLLWRRVTGAIAEGDGGESSGLKEGYWRGENGNRCAIQ